MTTGRVPFDGKENEESDALMPVVPYPKLMVVVDMAVKLATVEEFVQLVLVMKLLLPYIHDEADLVAVVKIVGLNEVG